MIEDLYNQMLARGWDDKTKCSVKEHDEYLKVSLRWSHYRKRLNKPEERLAKYEKELKNGQCTDEVNSIRVHRSVEYLKRNFSTRCMFA